VAVADQPEASGTHSKSHVAQEISPLAVNVGWRDFGWENFRTVLYQHGVTSRCSFAE
jgi:hypothetical protein